MQAFVKSEDINKVFKAARIKLELDTIKSIENRYLCTDLFGYYLVYDNGIIRLSKKAINPCNARFEIENLHYTETVFDAFAYILEKNIKAINESLLVMRLFDKNIFYDGNNYFVEESNKYKCNRFIDLFSILNTERKKRLKYYLHIGLPKTGTKFLQNNVFIKLNKIHYIDWKSFTFTKIVLKFKYQNAKLHEYEIKKYFDEYIQYIEEEGVLISDESLVNAEKSSQSFYSNITALNNIFPSANILVSLREQSSFLQSLYCQSLKNGEWRSPIDFLKFNRHKDVFLDIDYDEWTHIDLEYFNYEKLINVIEGVFERKNINILIYEKLKNEPEQYVNKLFKYFDEEKTRIDVEKPINRRPGKIGLFIFRCLNPFLYIPNKQLGIIPDRLLFHYLSKEIDNFEYKYPIHNVSRNVRRINIMKRFIIDNAIKISDKASIKRFVEIVDQFFYKPAKPFSNDIVKKIKSKYRLSNQKLDEKYGLEIDSLWE